jgi:hypothetical protein
MLRVMLHTHIDGYILDRANAFEIFGPKAIMMLMDLIPRSAVCQFDGIPLRRFPAIGLQCFDDAIARENMDEPMHLKRV